MRTLFIGSMVSMALLVGAPAMAAVSSDPIQAFQQAFSTDDATSKRDALRELGVSPLEDAVVLPLLVDGVNDRQVHDDAVTVLRERTGLAPPVYFGQSHYPGYPANDHPESWQLWLQDWRTAHRRDASINRALMDAMEAKRQADEALALVQASDARDRASASPAGTGARAQSSRSATSMDSSAQP